MIFESMKQLWRTETEEVVREAIIDTVVIALDMRVVFTEQQIESAIMCLHGLFGIEDEDTILNYLKESVARVNASNRREATEAIGRRLAHMDLATRETLMALAIVYFHFSEEDDLRKPMRESILPHLGIALDVVDSIPKLLITLRDAIDRHLDTN